MWVYHVEMFKTGGLFSGKINEREVETTLNRLATEGWEVVSTTSTSRFVGESHTVLYTFRKEN